MKPHLPDLLFGCAMASHLQWSGWLRGLVSAIIGGGSSAVTGAFVLPVADNEHLAMGSHAWWAAVVTLFLANAGLHGFAYLSKQPVPDKEN